MDEILNTITFNPPINSMESYNYGMNTTTRMIEDIAKYGTS